MPRLSKIGAAALAAFGWTGGASVSASVLVVAGGGGGCGGGGGAGGYRTTTASLNPTLSYTVTVGAGGAGAVFTSTTGTVDGNSGSSSIFDVITSSGGGGGGNNDRVGVSGASGGGGGASGVTSRAGGTGNTPSTSPSQGNNGGTNGAQSSPYPSGGGGGSSAVGSNGGSTASGAGGAGTANSISGSSVTYAGGGGGGIYTGGGSAGAGGSGGGGTGNGASGTANLGGGGGGANLAGNAGGNGGSGVVIISYAGTQKFGGGNVTTDGTNTIHTFTTSGTLSPLSSLTASTLVVAGGAGGGKFGGGGGAGGYRTSSVTIDTNSNYVITVGAGGAGATARSANGINGSDSAFFATTSTGGGGGNSATVTGANTGGSGGGIGNNNGVTASGAAGNTPSTSPSQGNNGGANSLDQNQCGGGGGASAVGGDGNLVASSGGNGGAGTASSISGSSVTYAGGGGGASVTTAGTGGAGGGGAGAISTNNGTAGTTNTGGGGGGSRDAAGGGGNGGAGGSGIVIISYPGSTQQMAGGTVTISGGNVIHTFTSSGYLTPIKYASRSLRFRSSASAYLNRTLTTPTNNKIWTWSGWVKRGILGTATSKTLFRAGVTSPSNGIRFEATTDVLRLFFNDASSGDLVTTQVFRDPSAWYHIIVAVDTTQATDSNRVKIYINGTQVTAFSTASYPSQNYDPQINSAVIHTLGAFNAGGTPAEFFDGYMTEINFVDGQQLTPSSFGTFNSYGVWQPITYGGSYGTNGFYLPFSAGTSSYAGIFNGSNQYLSMTSSTAYSLSGNFTVEAYVCPTATAPGNDGTIVGTLSTNGLKFLQTAGAYTIGAALYGSSAFITSTIAMNANVWNHVAITRSGTTVTLWVNGVSAGTATQSAAFSATAFIVGGGQTSAYFAGNISNVRVVNGTAVYTSNFTPSTSPLTAITNTTFLTLQNSSIVDNSTNALTITNNNTVTTFQAYPFVLNIAADSSPAGNNWTTNNISLASGSTYDSMTDVPTLTSSTANNYCVLNPLITDYTNSSVPVAVKNGNLQLYRGSGDGWGMCGSTFAVSSGKWYWEATSEGGSGGVVGIHKTQPTGYFAIVGYNEPNGYGYGETGSKFNNNTGTSYGSAVVSGTVVGIALDMDAGTLTFYNNNTSQGVAFSGLSGTFMPAFSAAGPTSWNANFGQRPFTYTAPTGFVALNTYNLSTPTIPNGATQMAATIWTGTGATLAISNVVNGTSFQPDFIWQKARSNAYSHKLYDSVRGITKQLNSDSTASESTTGSALLTSIDSGGFTVGNDTGMNGSGSTFVGWQWKANGAGVSNTSGSITSTVSANTTAGFSIVTYTGTGANATVGHGLGVAPSMVITKKRSSTSDWGVYHTSIGNTNYLLLDTTAASAASSTYWNNTTPTSSVFSIGTADAVNISTATYVAYVFAAVAGYSAFGSYTGNGSTDGPFVYCGFRPRWVMIKRSDSTGNWLMFDTSRDTYNQAEKFLFANTSDSEQTSADVKLDLISNGFKIRQTSGNINASGGTIIYMAFAENPFKYSNAR